MLTIETGHMHLTIYRGAKNEDPLDRVDLPWPELAEQLTLALDETAPRKDALLAFGPYRLQAGATRADAAVVERTAIAIDSDAGADPEAFVERLIDLGLAGLVYTSPSDTPALRKCRVVVPLAAPLAPDAARDTMNGLAEALGLEPGCGVEKCQDDSRIYFIGRVQGTPPRQHWSVDGDLLEPSVVPPPTLDWSAKRKRTRATTGAAALTWDDADLAEAVRIATTEAPSIEGEGGEANLLRVTRLIGDVLGPDADAIAAVLLEHFNPRCEPPWGDDEAGGPGDKAKREAARQTTASARVARANRRRLRGESASERVAATPDTGAVFLVTPKGREVFVFDPRSESYQECVRDNLIVVLRATGADELVTMTDTAGRVLPTNRIVDAGPTAVVREAITDFSSPATCLRDGDRILLGVVCPTIEPRHDAGVAAWLEALAGDELAAVQQWIASTRQDLMHRLATALCLVGAHSVGKTVFAQVCARLWGAEPVELGHVAAQFNATMATCPIVLDDECKCLARRTITTEEFRVLVQARSRMYEPKGRERRLLLGAQRFVLTANDLADIRFANALGHGAVDALAERITVVQIDDDQAALAIAALDAVRLPNGDLDWDRLAGHFEHLRQTVALPDGRVRFLGQGLDRARARRAVTADAADADQAVYERLQAVLTGVAKPGAAFMAHGRLWVKVRAFADALALSSGADRWDLARVRRALEPVRGPRCYVAVDGQTIRAREVDPGRLAEMLR